MTINPRKSWTNRAPRFVNRIEGAVTDVFFHYPADKSFPAGRPLEDKLRGYQDFHMDGRGWSDTAYTHAVFPNGELFELRGWGVEGGHTFGHNKTSYALLFMVTTQGPGSKVTPEMRAGAQEWLQVGVAEGYLTPQVNIRGHKEVRGTQCPGPEVMKEVEYFRSVDWLSAGEVSDELARSYQAILGIEPTEFAQTWQRKINSGELTLNDVRWELHFVSLREEADEGPPVELHPGPEDPLTEDDLLQPPDGELEEDKPKKGKKTPKGS